MGKANRIPELRLSAGSGVGSSSGLLTNNSLNFARLEIDATEAINWGKNLEIKAYEAEILAAEATVSDRRRQIDIAIKTQDAMIESFLKQLHAKRNVSELAEQRILSFAEDFRSGAVTIVEAVNVLETLKTVKVDVLTTEHALHLSEITKAQALGILGPFPAQSFETAQTIDTAHSINTAQDQIETQTVALRK